MRPDPFQRKTYGRIFVKRPEDVAIVDKTIEEVDPFEAGYAPGALVSVYAPGNGVIYLHKFEIDKVALIRACLAKGVWIWCVDGCEEFDTL